MTDRGFGFNWSNAESIVIRANLSIAVYADTAGDVIIRQEGVWRDDDDAIVVVSPEHAHVVTEAILAAARAAMLRAEREDD